MDRSTKSPFQALRWVALLLAACPLAPAFADSYLVTPVSLTLNADNPLGEFRLVNMDQRTLHVQLEVVRWTQEGNQNVEKRNDDFIISPMLAEIPPGGSQIVRLGLRQPAAAVTEQSYRVMFREIPDGAPEGARRILLNYSVPLFVAPATEGGQQLAWTLRKVDSNTLVLQVTNSGIMHAKIQIHSLRYDKQPGTAVVSDAALSENLRENPLIYVLPGASRELKLSAVADVRPGERLRLSIDLDASRQDVPLTVQ